MHAKGNITCKSTVEKLLAVNITTITHAKSQIIKNFH